MLSVLFLLVSLQAISGTASAFTWDIQTPFGAWIFPGSLAIDSTDKLHIALIDTTVSQDFDLEYARWDGTAWNVELVDSVGHLFSPSLALDSNDRPHIAYTDFENHDLRYAAWNGSTWSIEVVDSSGDVGRSPSLALNSSNQPHIVYRDATNATLKYAHLGGSVWVRETIDTLNIPNTLTVSSRPSVAIDGQDLIHVAYSHDTEILKYALFQNGRWEIEIVDDTGNVGLGAELDLDASDSPHIAYFDNDNDALKHARLKDGGWLLETVTGLVNSPQFSMAVDGSDRPSFAYIQSDGSLRYLRWNGTAWSTREIIDSSGSITGPLIEVDSGDRPYVVYRETISQILHLAIGVSPSEPAIPTSVVAIDGNGYVQLTWAPPLTDGGSDILGYRLYRGATPNDLALLAKPGNILQFNDTGLSNGVTYHYAVSAINAAGQGPRSNTISATPAVVPSAPRNLEASGDDSVVSLSWDPPVDDGGSVVNGYRIFRSTGTGSPDLLAELGTVLSHSDTTVENGITYRYKVSALNKEGEGPATPEATATPRTIPGAPQNLSVQASDQSVQLLWEAPLDDGGRPITGFRLYRVESGGPRQVYANLSIEFTFADEGVTNGVSYTYQVSALNEAGEGPLSNEVTALPAAVPAPPASLRADISDRLVLLDWEGPSQDGGAVVSGYRVYRGTVNQAWEFLAAVAQTMYSDMEVENGESYSYRVTALNRVGESLPSEVVTARPVGPPGSPLNLTAFAAHRSVRLIWDPPANDGGLPVVNYRVYRSTVPGEETLLTTVGPSGQFEDQGLENEVTYYYRITAVNDDGEGPLSERIKVTPVTQFGGQVAEVVNAYWWVGLLVVLIATIVAWLFVRAKRA